MSRRLLMALLLAVCSVGIVSTTTPASAWTGPAAPAIPPAETGNGKLMLLMDSSGSMSDQDASGRPKIEAARGALKQVVGGLPGGAQAGMRVFGATVKGKASPTACTDSQLAVPIGTDNRPALSAAVDSYKPFGETPMAYAMQQAAKDLGSTGQRSMILVSDGQDTCSPDPCAVSQQIADQGIDVKIDVVGFRVTGKAQQDLQCIAKVGRGSYYDASNTQDLTASLKTLSTRAFRPFTLTGTPVAGTPIIDGAPMVSPGQWVSRIGESKDERYYQLGRTPGTTLYVSVVGRSTGREDTTKSLSVSVRTTNGESCYASDSSWSSDWGTTAMPAGAVARVDANDEPCGYLQNLTIKVATDNGGEPQQTLGSDAMPFELRVTEEKPVTNVATLPAPTEDDDTPADWSYPLSGQSMVGGAGFSDAPKISPNTTYAGTLLPGEVQIFRVPVQYGQKLVARSNIAPPSIPMKSALAESDDDLSVRLGLFNPARQSYGGYGTMRLSDYTTDRQDASVDTRTIAWRNRELSSSPTYLGGDYFIAVAAAQVPTGGAPVSFLIRGDVTGTPGGAPAYGAPGTAQPTAPSTDDTPSSTSSTAAPSSTSSTSAEPTPGVVAAPPTAEEDNGLPMPLLIGGGAVALLALISAGAWMALRRKETQPTSAGPAPTGWDNQNWQPPYGQG